MLGCCLSKSPPGSLPLTASVDWFVDCLQVPEEGRKTNLLSALPSLSTGPFRCHPSLKILRQVDHPSVEVFPRTEWPHHFYLPGSQSSPAVCTPHSLSGCVYFLGCPAFLVNHKWQLPLAWNGTIQMPNIWEQHLTPETASGEEEGLEHLCRHLVVMKHMAEGRLQSH